MARTQVGGALGRAHRWLFADPTTGELPADQLPHPAFWVFVVARVVGWLTDDGSSVGRAAEVVAGVALAVSAVHELVRGANRFRRILAAVVLALLGLIAVGALVG